MFLPYIIVNAAHLCSASLFNGQDLNSDCTKDPHFPFSIHLPSGIWSVFVLVMCLKQTIICVWVCVRVPLCYDVLVLIWGFTVKVSLYCWMTCSQVHISWHNEGTHLWFNIHTDHNMQLCCSFDMAENCTQLYPIFKMTTIYESTLH